MRIADLSRQQHSRRSFLAAASTMAVTVAFRPIDLCGVPVPDKKGDHPVPRDGIDASHVLSEEVLANYPDAKRAYDSVRQIPEIADGIRCHCGCKDIPGYYSLLTCYEEGMMATMCEVCQGEGRLAYRLHSRGRTLDQIRAAIDARYG